MVSVARYLASLYRVWCLRLAVYMHGFRYRKAPALTSLPCLEDHQHPVRERVRAAMLLGAIGDTVGYLNGCIEFDRNLRHVHWTIRVLGGLEDLNLKPLVVSDDTVMHLATARALCESLRPHVDCRWLTETCKAFAHEYIRCMTDMAGRAPGGTTVAAISILEQVLAKESHAGDRWHTPQSRNRRGGGCGAAMRAVPVGLAFKSDDPLLYTVAVEASRITHNHPTGYLGAVASALFTALALEDVPVVEWGMRLLALVPEVERYLHDVDGRKAEWDIREMAYFVEQWQLYLDVRGIRDGYGPVKFPMDYGDSQVRDAFFSSLSYYGCGGASGHDSPMIAYDCLLYATVQQDSKYLAVVDRSSWSGPSGVLATSALHSGDSDSTAILACAWYGALFGFHGVPHKHLLQVEYAEQLVAVADELFQLSPHGKKFKPTPRFAPPETKLAA